MTRRLPPVTIAAPWDVPGWSELPFVEQKNIRSVLGESRQPMTMTIRTLADGYTLRVNSWFSYTLIGCGAITRETLEHIAVHHGLNKRDYDLVETLLRLATTGIQAVKVREVREIAITTSVSPASFESLPACINAVATRINWSGRQIQLQAFDENANTKLKCSPGFRWIDKGNVFYFIPTASVRLL